MALRLELQTILEEALGSDNVYFQPPASLVMQYPCIVYMRNNADTNFANNKPYHDCLRYQVTLIDRNPDNPVRDTIAALPMTLYQRFFVADNLNHDVFYIYH